MIYRSQDPITEDFGIKIEQLKNKGFKSKEIATILSTLYNVSKNEIYNLTMQ